MVGSSKVVAGGEEEVTVTGNAKEVESTGHGVWRTEGEGLGRSCSDSQVSSLGGGWRGLLLAEAGDTRGKMGPVLLFWTR